MLHIINTITIATPNKYPALRYKSAILYYLRITFPSMVTTGNVQHYGQCGQCGEVAGNVTTLYKLGYTTTSLQERVHGKPASYYVNKYGKRVRAVGHNGMGLPTGAIVHVISTYQHSNASLVYQWEQELHKRYKMHGYKGAAVMGNGNTELYVRDILELDN